MAAAKSAVTARVLLVDDDEAICGLVSKYLQHHGHSVDTLSDGREMDRALQAPFDVILLDMGLPGIDGLSLLDRVSREHPEIAVVMMTAATGVDSIVDAMRRGAFDYLTKPLDLQRLAIVVRNAAESTRLRLESDGLRAAMLRGDGGPHLICGSQPMSEVISLVERVAASRVPVLIYGEAGAGKELVAQRIHARSRRRDGPFVVVNCAQKPPEALGERLFGANGAGGGRFDEARGGTLFLDEVGEMSPELQARLHRALHDASVHERRTGGDGDVRVIAATVKHLPTEVSRGTFRADLFYRLNVFSITVPPLRDRKDDIPALARYALARFAARENQPPPTLADDVLDALSAYPWPCNVRELNNVVERMALVATAGAIRLDDLPEEIRAHSAPRAARDEPSTTSLAVSDDDKASVRPLHEIEREMMIAALRETGGNVSEAARRLGIGRATFYRRAQRHGLTREDGFPG